MVWLRCALVGVDNLCRLLDELVGVEGVLLVGVEGVLLVLCLSFDVDGRHWMVGPELYPS